MYFCFFSITSFAQTVCSRKRLHLQIPSYSFFLPNKKTEQKLRFLFGADEGT